MDKANRTGNGESSEWEPDRVADERNQGRGAAEAGLDLAYEGARDQRLVGQRTIDTEVLALQILSVGVEGIVSAWHPRQALAS